MYTYVHGCADIPVAITIPLPVPPWTHVAE
jgi:hypothetical protein